MGKPREFKNFEFYEEIYNCDDFNTSNYKVYGLFDPFSAKLIYVGCTKQTMSARLLNHLQSPAVRSNMRNFIEKCKEAKTMPIPIIFFSTDNKDLALNIEGALIYVFSNLDYEVDLKNVNCAKGCPSTLNSIKTSSTPKFDSVIALVTGEKNNTQLIKEVGEYQVDAYVGNKVRVSTIINSDTPNNAIESISYAMEPYTRILAKRINY